MGGNAKDTFSGCHPAVNFLFFAGAILLAMIFYHPAYLVCSLVLSSSYYLTIRGRAGLRMVLGMIPLLLMVSFVNLLFNARGEHVLFTCFGRNFTAEALLFGVIFAVVLISVLMWFACYNAVMTSDKFLYLFGRLVPSLSLVLTMVLRLVPNYKRKAEQVSGARRGIGKSADTGTKQEKMEHGFAILSALTSWALEGGIITADSMRSRGYGCGTRTSFSLYRLEGRDRLLLVLMAFLIGTAAVCGVCGGAATAYTFQMEWFDNLNIFVGTVTYAVFLSIPTVMNLLEAMVWHILRSKI